MQERGEGLALAPSKDSSLSGILSGSWVWACNAVASGKQGQQLREEGRRCLKFESIAPPPSHSAHFCKSCPEEPCARILLTPLLRL